MPRADSPAEALKLAFEDAARRGDEEAVWLYLHAIPAWNLRHLYDISLDWPPPYAWKVEKGKTIPFEPWCPRRFLDPVEGRELAQEIHKRRRQKKPQGIGAITKELELGAKDHVYYVDRNFH